MKRVVFRHPDGLYQIVGVAEDNALAVVFKNVETRGQVMPFTSLYKVTTRAAYYKEPMVPASYTFYKAQL